MVYHSFLYKYSIKCIKMANLDVYCSPLSDPRDLQKPSPEPRAASQSFPLGVSLPSIETNKFSPVLNIILYPYY